MELIERSAATGAIRVEAVDGTTVVSLVGEVDAALRDDASASMARALVTGSPVVIDSTDATFIDSAGLAFVLQLSRAASEAGIAVSLRDPHRVVHDVLDMIGLGGELPV
ncbi:STAS domain-containing protein [Cellulomonas sp. URHE0023]|uniref:STAS domain-containing protein n=1 Tax=Cellulomonas sp. URHE0023 TaxID=1380354 RepID=UPI0004818098|nr:STAS domain-containing protein [Cellulomonas sp. URHE0023]